MELTLMAIHVTSELLDSYASFWGHFNNFLEKYFFNSCKFFPFNNKKSLFVPSFLLHLFFSEVARCCHFMQYLFNGSFKASFSHSGIVEELASVFTASDHFGVKNVGVYVWVFLEDVIAVDHHQCSEVYLLLS